ncbi:AMP-binding protein [Chloroflexota bacterium]
MPGHTGYNSKVYELSTGESVNSLTCFCSPIDEYRAAFADRTHLFLNYYTFKEGSIQKRTLTRGEFWDLACSAAAYLHDHEISKGDRIIHGFSSNVLGDLVFRLAAVLMGCVPVTINWQADDTERIVYKAKLTNAKLMVYDSDFTTRMEQTQPSLSTIQFLEARKVEGYQTANCLTYPESSFDDEKMVIFTSGTTGKPKGVSLSQRSYLTNRLTFEQYFNMSESTQLDLLLVNPLHHTNSSALADWGMRRGGAIIHLIQSYTTAYWKILVEVAGRRRELLVTSLVSRHIDFLESLLTQSKPPIDETENREALSKTDILIGSAPVGPTTVERILKFSNRLPHVRFGSTETCLEVMATPTIFSQNELMKAFKAGWLHHYKGEEAIGYFIGREHFPFTRVKVIKAIDPGSNDYFRACEIGEPGYLVTQGPNIMSGYVGDVEATEAVFREGWYTGLRDIVFALRNEKDGQLDYYWMSRDSALLIRGGANYAYDQIAAELSKVLVEDFGLEPEQFKLAVVGLQLESEHEDSCCLTIELSREVDHIEPQLKANFIETASRKVSKGARPDHIRFAQIPVSFKGEILYSQLKQDFLDLLKRGI